MTEKQRRDAIKSIKKADDLRRYEPAHLKYLTNDFDKECVRGILISFDFQADSEEKRLNLILFNQKHALSLIKKAWLNVHWAGGNGIDEYYDQEEPSYFMDYEILLSSNIPIPTRAEDESSNLEKQFPPEVIAKNADEILFALSNISSIFNSEIMPELTQVKNAVGSTKSLQATLAYNSDCFKKDIDSLNKKIESMKSEYSLLMTEYLQKSKILEKKNSELESLKKQHETLIEKNQKTSDFKSTSYYDKCIEYIVDVEAPQNRDALIAMVQTLVAPQDRRQVKIDIKNKSVQNNKNDKPNELVNAIDRQTEALKEAASRPTTQNIVYPQANSTTNVGCDQKESEFKTYLPTTGGASGAIDQRNEQKRIGDGKHE